MDHDILNAISNIVVGPQDDKESIPATRVNVHAANVKIEDDLDMEDLLSSGDDDEEEYVPMRSHFQNDSSPSLHGRKTYVFAHAANVRNGVCMHYMDSRNPFSSSWIDPQMHPVLWRLTVNEIVAKSVACSLEDCMKVNKLDASDLFSCLRRLLVILHPKLGSPALDALINLNVPSLLLQCLHAAGRRSAQEAREIDHILQKQGWMMHCIASDDAWSNPLSRMQYISQGSYTV